MTYDPYRNDLPRDPYRDPRADARDPSAGGGASILLAALLLAAIGGFIYFYTGPDDQVAINDTRPQITAPATTGSGSAPETTGSSANMPPAPEPRLEPKVKPVE
jgi:hypothetical protein